MVPLFITLQEYGGEVVILIAEWHFSWFDRFGSVFRQLTNYPPVLLGLKDEIHCFPQLVVGQVAHAEYIVDPNEMRGGASIADFQVG